MSQQRDVDSQNICPLAEAALLLNSKWDLILVYNLMDGPLRFSALKKKISDGLKTPITSSSLTRILRKLENETILERNISAEVGESVEIRYKLTDKGRGLQQTINELKQWGNKFLIG